MTVKQLKAELEALPDELPVFVWDETDEDPHPVLCVDPTISDRVDLNFRSGDMYE